MKTAVTRTPKPKPPPAMVPTVGAVRVVHAKLGRRRCILTSRAFGPGDKVPVVAQTKGRRWQLEVVDRAAVTGARAGDALTSHPALAVARAAELPLADPVALARVGKLVGFGL